MSHPGINKRKEKCIKQEKVLPQCFNPSFINHKKRSPFSPSSFVSLKSPLHHSFDNIAYKVGL